jgi:hypothetical protein
VGDLFELECRKIARGGKEVAGEAGSIAILHNACSLSSSLLVSRRQPLG